MCFISILLVSLQAAIKLRVILGDPGAHSGGEGKSERAEKYGSDRLELVW